MKISRKFRLGKSQHELDFVDIDPSKDLRLFLDPYFLGCRTDFFSTESSRTLHNFFETFIAHLRARNDDDARAMFEHLGEPNETCLGLSLGHPAGRGIGRINADMLFESIKESRAVQTGLVEHMEDFRLFVEGIDKDKISDMTTNVIRGHLIQYTKTQCALWEIPMRAETASGFYWNRHRRRWETTYTDMLVVEGETLLLVPKGVVSYVKRYTPRKYHQHFILNYLKHEQLRMNGPLVQHRRDQTPFVTKKSVVANGAQFDKAFLATFTAAHPDVFNDFRTRTATTEHSLDNEELAPTEELHAIIDHLIARLDATPTGFDNATTYHKLVTGILELIFYPALTCPDSEVVVDEGRKRIDISFDNAASTGFFLRLSQQYETPSQFIFAECKNYGNDVANPEVDQLAGRFTPNRGRFGLLVCRSVQNMPLLLARCRDTQTGGRGTILPLTDDDLKAMLAARKAGADHAYEALMQTRFHDVALGSRKRSSTTGRGRKPR